MPKQYLSSALIAVLVVGGTAVSPNPTRNDVEFSGPPGSAEPNLTATSDGRAVLTWHEPVEGRRYALKLAVREAKEIWSVPQTITVSDQFFVNWADFPSLLELPDGTWIVHWLERMGGGRYAYGVKLALSQDRGATWSEPVVPHRDDSPQEHGFVSMAPLADDVAGLIWLDGRAMTGHGPNRGAMTIRGTAIASDGSLAPDMLLDDRVCECCQTALVRTGRGLVAAYRDRDPEEIRNVAIVRFQDGAWSDPAPVHNDNWYYPGCPVNGPQLAASGDTVVIAWYTAPNQKARVNAAFSFDAGKSFGEPVRIDDGDPLGRVDVEFLQNGVAMVIWAERTRSAAELRGRRVRPDGKVRKRHVIATTAESRASGFPRMAVVGGELLLAWTEVGRSGGVRVTSVPIDAFQ